MQNKILTVLAACMLLITLTPKPAEAFVKFRTNYFSSPVKGTILYDGEPVVGAQVKREISGAGNQPTDKHFDETVTDNDGRFELPEVSNKTFFFRPQMISANPGASQLIHVYFKNEKYAIWSSHKSSFEKGKEDVTYLNEILLTCELSNNNGENPVTESIIAKCEVKGPTSDE